MNYLKPNKSQIATVRDFKNMLQINDFEDTSSIQMDDKLYCIASNQNEWLLEQFKLMRDKTFDSKISFQNFQQILLKVNVPDNYKITYNDFIHLKNAFGDDKDRIDYVQFLKKYQKKSKSSEQKEKKKQAFDFFRQLGKVLKKKGIDFKTAFYK